MVKRLIPGIVGLIFAGSLSAQAISRNDSLRELFGEQNKTEMGRIKTDKSIATSLAEEKTEKILNFTAIRDDVNCAVKDRVAAQWNLVVAVLYRDTPRARQELQNYIDMSIQFQDSVKTLADALNCLGFYYRQMEYYDSAEVVLHQAVEYGRQNGRLHEILNARIELALLDEDQGKYDAAILQYLDILDSCVHQKLIPPEARCRINLGNLYRLQGKYDEALYQLQEALDLCVIGKLVGYMASTLCYLGNVNLAIDEYEKAEQYYIQALKWSDRQNNSSTKRLTLTHFIQLREKEKKLPEAMALARDLLAFSIELGLTPQLSEDHFLLAELYRKNGQLDSALRHIDISLELYGKSKRVERHYKALGIAGWIHLDKGNIGAAEKFCLQSYLLNVEIGDQAQQMSTCECLYKVNKARNNTGAALRYFEEFSKLEHSLSNEEESRKIIKEQMAGDFRYGKYRDSIEAANILSLVKLEGTQKLQKRSWLLLFLGFGLLLVLSGAFFLWRAYRQNRKQKEELDKLNQLNKQIFSIISHDFHGPLLSLNLMVDTLKDSSLDERKLHAYLKDMRHQISQTSQILDNLLNWAKAELRIDLGEKSQTNLLLIAKEMDQVFATKIGEKSIIFLIEVGEETVLEIHPDLLRILLRNLLNNAIKYSHKGGTIVLGYDPKSRQILMKDSGVGMDAATRAGILKNPAHSRMGTDQETGFGIGLFITTELLRKIGWSIQVESEAGKGTTFRIQTNV